jgi:Multicopper oxidase
MAIEDHPGFELIEVDSDYIAAHNASHLEVSSGQRYSFLLKTKSAEEIRALNKTTFWANIETRWRATRDKGAWLLKYTLEPGSDVFANDTEAHNVAYEPIPSNLNETVPLPNEKPFWVMPELKPLHESDVPPRDEEVSRRIIVDMRQLSTGNGSTQKIFWEIDQHMVNFLSFPTHMSIVTQFTFTVLRR